MVEEKEGREEVKTQEKQGRASGQGHLSFSESQKALTRAHFNFS